MTSAEGNRNKIKQKRQPRKTNVKTESGCEQNGNDERPNENKKLLKQLRIILNFERTLTFQDDFEISG